MSQPCVLLAFGIISFDDYARTRFGAVMATSVKALRLEVDCRALDKNRQNE
jgi:hypothetical protein